MQLCRYADFTKVNFGMRVLHIYSGNLYGGIETYLVTLAKYRSLAPEMEPHFALCFEGRLSEELRATGVPVEVLGKVRFSRPWTVWLARRHLERLLKENRPDLVLMHECWPHSLFAPVVRAQRLPLVFLAHDIHLGRHWLEKWARRTPPDLVLANSRVTQDALPVLFAGVRSEVLHYPVPAPLVPDLAATRRDVRATLDTSKDAVVIIQASRLERWKGHELLLEALGRLKDLPGWECWIAGGAQRPHEETYLSELNTRAARLGIGERVRFLGQRTDVQRLLAAADIHCQPNTGPEPFGIAFVEALYAGLPVVTTALGAALEIIDASCGTLVPPNNSESLAGSLRRLIEEAPLRKSFVVAGPLRAGRLCAPETQLVRLQAGLAALVREGMAA